MGCSLSRINKANQQLLDMNTIAIQFLGGSEKQFNRYPQDLIVWNFAVTTLGDITHHSNLPAELEIKSDMSCNNSEVAKTVTKMTLEACTNTIIELEAHVFSVKDSKKMMVQEKYEAAEALRQIKQVKQSLLNVGDDTNQLRGLPSVLLELMIKHSFFFDMVKCQAISAEFNEEKLLIQKYSLSGVAALTGLAVKKAQKQGLKVWLGELLDEYDFDILEEIAGVTNRIHFPFLVPCFKSKEAALEFLTAANPPSKKKYFKVLIEVWNAATFQTKGGQLVSQRLNGTIEEPMVMVDGICCF